MSRGQLEQRLLVLVTLGLVAFGLVMVYSATSASAAIGNGDPDYVSEAAGVYAVAGFALMLAASRFDNRRLRLLAPPLLLAALAPLCRSCSWSRRRSTARAAGSTLGPAVVPAVGAREDRAADLGRGLSRPKGAPRTLGELWQPIGMVTTLFCALILIEPDLGTTIALVLMLAGMLVVAGVPAPTWPPPASLAVAAGARRDLDRAVSAGARLQLPRPVAGRAGHGLPDRAGADRARSGGLTGKGLGEGVQKINYLPEQQTDMILAVIGEELGLIGTTAVIAAFAAFAFAGFTVALRCRDPFGKLLAAGITSLVCGQAAVNLAAVLGVAPLTGIPLPFVSYGGSSLVVLLGAVGILLNIAGDGRAPQRRTASSGA